MPEVTLRSLLPQNRTALEASIADAIDTTAHDERTISMLYRPHGVEIRLLPWLAWSVDVLAWPRSANETTRRRLASGSWRLHRLQGTLAGFREIAEVFGGEIVGAITPPAKLYAAPALTREERNAFVARYPQLRLYRHRTVGSRVGLHCGDTLGRWSPVQSDALLRLTPRAYLWRDGVETELAAIERTTTRVTRQAETVTEVRAPGRAAGRSFCAAHPRHLVVSDAARRIYRVRLTEAYRDSAETLRRTVVQPAEHNLAPVSVHFDAVATPGVERGLFAARPLNGCLQRSTARDRMFQRLYLFDPEIEVIRRTATLHCDAGRLGMPAHHAELAVRVPGTASRQAAGRYCRGYLVATNKAALGDCLAAMRDVMRASDRIGIDTTLSRPARAGESVFSGGLTAGDWTLN